MNFFEAMEAVYKGEKIRRTHWQKGLWAGLKEQKYSLCRSEKVSYSLLTNEHAMGLGGLSVGEAVMYEDWELFVEEVKK